MCCSENFTDWRIRNRQVQKEKPLILQKHHEEILHVFLQNFFRVKMTLDLDAIVVYD